MGALFAIAGFGFLTAACDRKDEQAENPVRPVRVITVAEQQGGETVSLSGVVEAKTEVDLAFRIGGRMVNRFVNVGDRVEAGKLIAQLDSQDEENAVRAAAANLSAAEGKFIEAEQNYDRQRQLLSRGHTTRQRYDAAVQTLNTLRGQADVARAQLATAKTRLNDTNLYADASGEVTLRGVNSGEVVQAGQMIVRIARKDGRDAVFDAPPSLMARVASDADISVALSIDPTVVASGRVREVSPQADPQTGTFRVRVGLTDPPSEMRLGSSIVGRATLEEQAGVAIPASALSRANGMPSVWVVDTASETVSSKPVEVAAFRASEVIVSGGIAPGDVVVTAGIQSLRPGQRVRLLGQPS
ncbi:MAG: efflux RND transporter periplasmic adaptor subunit [Hyphomicrobium sp.]|nr:efflux RND transporter periplasmic adaptor subunit [Hyphomicrobium sp.]